MTVYQSESTAGPKGLHVCANVTTTFTRPSNTDIYAANDAVSDSTSAPTVLTLANAAYRSGGAGIIRGITMVKSTATVTLAAFSILILRTTFTGLEDNAAVDLSDAEARTIIAGVSFPAADALALGLNAVWSKTNLDIPFVCEAGGTSLYLVVRADDTYTPASAERFDLTFLIERP